MRATAFLLPLLAACAPAPGGRVPQTASAPPTPGTRAGAAPLATKRVAARLAPATLVAEDATRCAVTPAAFEGTRVGAPVRCAWARPDADRS